MTSKTHQENRKHYLYRITNLNNGKVYIGQTVSPKERWRNHYKMSKKPKYVVHYAIKKYGIDNFKFEIIATCKDWEDANELEILLISQYKSLRPHGYNSSAGGFKTVEPHNKIQFTEEQIQAILNDNRSCKDIGKDYNVSLCVIWRLKKELSVNRSVVEASKERRYFSDEQALAIKTEYHNDPKRGKIAELGRKYNVNPRLIWKYINVRK